MNALNIIGKQYLIYQAAVSELLYRYFRKRIAKISNCFIKALYSDNTLVDIRRLAYKA